MTARAIPATMRAVEASGFGLDKLALVEKPVPVPQRGEILVQIKAATLNYRDLAILQGTYKPDFKGSFIPGSDDADARRLCPMEREGPFGKIAITLE